MSWSSLTGRAGAVAAGPDAQSSQVGEHPLEVEGGQRRVHVLGGLLQPGQGGVKADPEAGGRVGEAGGAKSSLAGAPRPQGIGCAWISGPTLTTQPHHSGHSRTLTGTSVVPPPPARGPGCGVSWNAAESGPGPPLPASAAWRVGSPQGGPGRSV